MFSWPLSPGDSCQSNLHLAFASQTAKLDSQKTHSLPQESWLDTPLLSDRVMSILSDAVHITAQTAKLGPQKTHSLAPGGSETLRVVPVQKRFRLVTATKGTWSDLAGSAINLHLEGNWMPLRVRSTALMLKRDVLRDCPDVSLPRDHPTLRPSTCKGDGETCRHGQCSSAVLLNHCNHGAVCQSEASGCIMSCFGSLPDCA